MGGVGTGVRAALFGGDIMWLVCNSTFSSSLLFVVVLFAKLCLTLRDPMDCTCQAPLSIGYSRQEYWSAYSSPGDQTYVSRIGRQILYG